MSDPTFTIFWSPEDKGYVATCDLYPSLSWIDPDPTEALDRLIDIIDETVEDL